MKGRTQKTEWDHPFLDKGGLLGFAPSFTWVPLLMGHEISFSRSHTEPEVCTRKPGGADLRRLSPPILLGRGFTLEILPSWG